MKHNGTDICQGESIAGHLAIPKNVNELDAALNLWLEKRGQRTPFEKTRMDVCKARAERMRMGPEEKALSAARQRERKLKRKHNEKLSDSRRE